MTKTIETEIENLKIYREQMANDIHELKTDMKDVKEFLMGEDPKIVTRKEFEAYKAGAIWARWIIGVITAVITAFIMLEITKVLK